MRISVMIRHLLAVVVLLSVPALIAGQACFAGDVSPSSLLGQKIKDFTLADTGGKEHTLSGSLGEKGVVVIFVSTRCPVSNAYNERMVALASEYQAKGFGFLGINANKAEDPTEMAEHATKHGWNFPVLKDKGNVIADRLGASVTPEVYLIDAEGVLRYHGRIDDAQDPAEIQSRDLKAALDALLSGQDVARKEAKAFGCSIKRV